MSNTKQTAEQVVIEVMRHFGFRRNYQVAEYFDVTPQTLSGWIKTGEIPLKHLMKYNDEVLNKEKKENIVFSKTEISKSNKFSWYRTKNIFNNNLKILFGIPLITTVLTIIYVFSVLITNVLS